MGTYGKSNYHPNSYLPELYRENWLIFPWNFGLNSLYSITYGSMGCGIPIEIC
jgi:hypothetical protein